MSDCNKLFHDFNKSITPSQDQMRQMKTSREILEKKITTKLKEKLDVAPTYFTQGSAARDMKAIIIKEDGTYDADRGIYLPAKPNVSAETVQRYVYDAVKDHTTDGAEHRAKCIRVYFRYAYNIDFPVYYEVKGEEYSYLAVKGNGWIKDDPSQMISWLAKNKDEEGQLLRIIKYMKAWASACSGKMPSGIALAVWAVRNFSAEADRDDISLYNTLKNLQSAVYYDVSCDSPVEPFDDLTAKLTENQKTNFKKRLSDFVDDAKKAIDEKNQLISSKLWRTHLGMRFPEGMDEDVDAKAATLLASAAHVLNQSAFLSKDGVINTITGIKHQPHRNYGG